MYSLVHRGQAPDIPTHDADHKAFFPEREVIKGPLIDFGRELALAPRITHNLDHGHGRIANREFVNERSRRRYADMAREIPGRPSCAARASSFPTDPTEGNYTP